MCRDHRYSEFSEMVPGIMSFAKMGGILFRHDTIFPRYEKYLTARDTCKGNIEQGSRGCWLLYPFLMIRGALNSYVPFQ